MTGLGIVIPTTGPGVGPIIPPPLPSPGVAGYTHRYAGARLTGADGAAITSWADSGASPTALAGGSGSGTAVVNRTEAYPFARLTGKQLASTVAETLPGTFVAVVRKAVVSQAHLYVGGVQFTRAGNGNHQMSGFGTGASGFITSTNPSADWTVLIGTIQSGAVSQTFRSGTSEVSGTVTPGTPAATLLGSSVSGQVVDVLDVILYSGLVMTPTQRLAVYNAMKAAYPSLTAL